MTWEGDYLIPCSARYYNLMLGLKLPSSTNLSLYHALLFLMSYSNNHVIFKVIPSNSSKQNKHVDWII